MEIKKYRDKNWLWEKYIVEELSMTEIARICNVRYSSTIHTWLRAFGIPRRDKSEAIKLALKVHPIGKGKDSPNWKGGRQKTSLGYIYIHQPNHPYVNSRGYVPEHRLIVEKRIGRYLYPWEIVHHKNRVRDDNRDKNLELLSGQSVHLALQKIYKENQRLKEQLADLLSIGI